MYILYVDKEKKEALTLMITLKNRKIESLISDNKGRIRCHLDQLLREPKTNDHGEPQTNHPVQLVCIPWRQSGRKRSTKLQRRSLIN